MSERKENIPAITYLSHESDTLALRSGMLPLHGYIKSDLIVYKNHYKKWFKKSWTLGHIAQSLSSTYYGSDWNYLVPCVDEWRMLSQLKTKTDVMHFLWGEFATPSFFPLFRRKAQKIMATFHCSQRRQWRVTKTPRWYRAYDHIVLVSEPQRDYFVDSGFQEDAITIVPLGVDTDYFSFRSEIDTQKKVLKCVLVGSTERDHDFAAKVMRSVGDHIHLTVCTSQNYHYYYKDVSNVRISPFLSDEELVALYQRSDLLLMPMLDCTANDAILESMSCGTPVMVNCVGGIPEYVDHTCNYVMIGKKVDEWVDLLKELNVNRDRLQGVRPKVREWAERFDWRIVADQYLTLYEKVLGE